MSCSSFHHSPDLTGFENHTHQHNTTIYKVTIGQMFSPLADGGPGPNPPTIEMMIPVSVTVMPAVAAAERHRQPQFTHSNSAPGPLTT
jgi:hypothetical protein